MEKISSTVSSKNSALHSDLSHFSSSLGGGQRYSFAAWTSSLLPSKTGTIKKISKSYSTLPTIDFRSQTRGKNENVKFPSVFIGIYYCCRINRHVFILCKETTPREHVGMRTEYSKYVLNTFGNKYCTSVSQLIIMKRIGITEGNEIPKSVRFPFSLNILYSQSSCSAGPREESQYRHWNVKESVAQKFLSTNLIDFG